MGTNYYLHRNTCPTCGHSDEPIHIGKSSGGWCFSLHVIPEDGINTLNDWYKEISKDGIVKNEYDEIVTIDELRDIVQNRGRDEKWESKPAGYSSWQKFHSENYSEQGPNGLLRHKIDGSHCIGHGEGTWDFIIGEFS